MIRLLYVAYGQQEINVTISEDCGAVMAWI